MLGVSYYKKWHLLNYLSFFCTYVLCFGAMTRYEREHFCFTKANQRVGTATREMFVSWFPRLLRPVVRPAIHALLDDEVVRSFGFPQPLRFLRYFLMASYPISNKRNDAVIREDEIYDWLTEKNNAAMCDYAAKPFELVGGMEGELPLAEEVPQAVPEAVAQAAESATASAAAAGVAKAEPDVRERLSTLQKIARLTVGQRIQLGMKGNKEERFILIRDGSKLVSVAVLQSPKLSDQEVEMFAAMKNVQEGVLREIARSHKYLKNYGVIRQLVNNPRTPLDLSLSLMNHLLINDLKSLSANKNVPDTVRKMATKRYKEKTEKKKPGE